MQHLRADIPLETSLEFDREAIQQTINETAVQVRKAPVNTTLALDEDKAVIQVAKGQDGRELDTEGLYEAVCLAFETGKFEPISWDYVVLPYEEADIDGLHETLVSQIQDARYDEETHTILEGVSGYRFDLEAAKTQISRANQGDTFTIPLLETEPALDAKTLNHQMFGTKLESRSSVYTRLPTAPRISAWPARQSMAPSSTPARSSPSTTWWASAPPKRATAPPPSTPTAAPAWTTWAAACARWRPPSTTPLSTWISSRCSGRPTCIR